MQQPATGAVPLGKSPTRVVTTPRANTLLRFGAGAAAVTAQNTAEQFYIIFRGLKTLFPKQSPSPVFCHKLWNREKGKQQRFD